MFRWTSCFVASAILGAGLAEASAISVDVSATANYHFAGQTPSDFPLRSTQYPSGAYYTFEGDGNNLACLPPFVDVSAYSVVSVNATGQWAGGPPPKATSDPDGNGNYGSGTGDAYDDLGISLLVAHGDRLVGVFLTDSKPDPARTPPILSSATNDDMTHPMLQQAFDIGANLENIAVPEGATRLFFGFRDNHGWNNNVGTVTATVVPEPSALMFLTTGLSALGLIVCRRRRRFRG